MWKLYSTFLISLGVFEISAACWEVITCRQKLNQFFPLIELPTEKDLTHMCPEVLNAMRCLQEKKAECGRKFYIPEDIEVLGRARLLLNDTKLVEEFCDIQSNLRRGYIRTFYCARRYSKSELPKLCKTTGEILYDRYECSIFTNGLAPKEYKEYLDNENCLILALTSHCIFHDLERMCGPSSRALFEEILNKLTNFRLPVCVRNSIAKVQLIRHRIED
ncbi:uncharacterized protein LOC118196761 [Stegodyphus dumicola]|uniref:uncharacterized protein LOC118196761 n=1 Tax=Stegodyphus dumicola TaxID=202533 RepID=UPI0015AD98F5|nr:uncharacterized protein LOC118196761 [Stegodyphus dumicola]